jgi:hypothetical protein
MSQPINLFNPTSAQQNQYLPLSVHNLQLPPRPLSDPPYCCLGFLVPTLPHQCRVFFVGLKKRFLAGRQVGGPRLFVSYTKNFERWRSERARNRTSSEADQSPPSRQLASTDRYSPFDGPPSLSPFLSFSLSTPISSTLSHADVKNNHAKLWLDKGSRASEKWWHYY